MAVSDGDTMTFKDKRRFFEKEIEEQQSTHRPKPREERKFTFLQEHEVVKLKKEEAKKVLSMSPGEVLNSVVDPNIADTTDYSVLISSLSSNTNVMNTSAHRSSATERLFGRNSLPRRPSHPCSDAQTYEACIPAVNRMTQSCTVVPNDDIDDTPVKQSGFEESKNDTGQ